MDHLVNFQVMDYCNTEFPNEFFDKIYAIESMCYAMDKAVFIREMYRILKVGGSLVIADAFLDEKMLQKEDIRQLDIWLKGWAVPNLPKINDFHNILKDAGFVGIEDSNMKKQIMPSAKKIYKIGRLFYPLIK